MKKGLVIFAIGVAVLAVVFAVTKIDQAPKPSTIAPVGTPITIKGAKIPSLLYVKSEWNGGLVLRDGDKERSLTDRGQFLWPSGSLIVAVDQETTRVVNWQTGQVLNPVPGGKSSFPAAGPQGRVALVQQGSDQDVLLVLPEGLSFTAKRIVSPAWSGGGELAFAALDETGRLRLYLWRMQLGSQTKPEKLKLEGFLNVAFPSFSPDGRKLAFAGEMASGWDVYVTSVEILWAATQPEMITAFGDAIDPVWGEGEVLLFTRSRQNRDGVAIAAEQTGQIPASFVLARSAIWCINLQEKQVYLVVEGGQMPAWFDYASGLAARIPPLIPPTPTLYPTMTPSPVTPSATPTKTSSPTVTRTPTRTVKPSRTLVPSRTPRPTQTPRPTNTPVPSRTPTATPSPKPSPIPTGVWWGKELTGVIGPVQVSHPEQSGALVYCTLDRSEWSLGETYRVLVPNGTILPMMGFTRTPVPLANDGDRVVEVRLPPWIRPSCCCQGRVRFFLRTAWATAG